MKLTKKKVKEDSIKKWEALVNNPLPIRSLEYEKLIKELKVSKYKADCALCEMFCQEYPYCIGCPINEIDVSCLNSSNVDLFSSYYWATTKRNRIKYAKKILKIIKEWEI